MTLLIDTPDALAAALERWCAAPFLAVDTEFVREETYYARLCLIQIGDGRESVCVDVLSGIDLPALLQRLMTPDTLKLFHAPGQDLEIFFQLAGRCPAPLFDSQIAAAMLGHGDQMGYAALVEKLAGIKVDKTLSRTNWARRPLGHAELAYAADDVRHLAALYPQLERELEQRGRLAWLREDCVRMADPARYLSDPENEWQRLKSLARLERSAQHVAARLAAWRERVAEDRNRPRKWILADDALYRLAERRPQTRAQLEELGVLPPKTLERHADALLEQIAAGVANPAPALAGDRKLSDADKARGKRLADRARAIAAQLDIPASLLAPRADLECLAEHSAGADIPLLRGWRLEVAGSELLQLLD